MLESLASIAREGRRIVPMAAGIVWGVASVFVLVAVGVGVFVLVFVKVFDAVGVLVNAMGEGVRVGGLRVGARDGTGITVAAGWLGSGHRPTASRKTQS